MAGLLIAGLVLHDVFDSVVLPRFSALSPFRVSAHLVRRLWESWRAFGFRLAPGERREDFLGAFAPWAMIVMLLVWISALILGFGLMLYAMSAQIKPPLPDFGSALYFAGTAILTIGFGDFVPTGAAPRVLMLIGGACGLSLAALVISLMFMLYGAFGRRETLILMLDARAGSPPSGVTLLETYARFSMIEQLPALFDDWERWAAEVLESHRAYPILPYFRSSHDNESWVSAMGAVLDAATLLKTAICHDASTREAGDAPVVPHALLHGSAHMTYQLGCHAVLDLAHWLGAGQGYEVGIERGEFEAALSRLRRAGWLLRESDAAWRDFQEARAPYAAPLNALARHFATPPTQWIGDRSSLSHLHSAAPSESRARRKKYREPA